MAALDKIRAQFISSGYVELPQEKYPKSLLWQPDLVFTKNGYTYLILVKSNNSIPPSFLNRIANIPKQNFLPLILFAQRLSANAENDILLQGISIGYFIRGKLLGLKIKKKLPKIIVQREIKKKLEMIDIFVSSKQDIPEREFVLDRLEFLRKLNSYPFAPPHLIEHDKFKIIQLFKHIDEVIENCEWIIIILEDNYSKVVSYEIKNAIKKINHDNIFMFVKSTNGCHTSWKKELNKIKNLPTKSIKYLPYNDLPDLEVWLSKAITKRMDEIQKKRKVKIFV